MEQPILLQVRQAQDLTQGICDFLEARGGSAPTPDLIAHFGATVSQARMALFRQLLKQVTHQRACEQSVPWTRACAGLRSSVTRHVLLHACLLYAAA